MAHELAGALQQASWIGQRCALKEPQVHMRREYVNIAEGHITQTSIRTAVMQDLPHLIPASPHHLKPLPREVSQFAVAIIQPRIDCGIVFKSPIEL